jgi:hypothetical protein
MSNDQKAREPKFGEWLRGIHASESNPQRDGMYVRTIHTPTGKVNAGKSYELTDGNGNFWRYPAHSTAPITRALEQPASAGEGFVVVPRDALLEVLRISDRKHDAWGAVKAALATPTPPATAQEDGRAAKAIVQRALDGLTVPKLSPSKQEYFTAGVRHLAQAINAELRAAMLTSPDSGKEGV